MEKLNLKARREKKRMTILSAAAAAFNENGYHNTKIDDLCEVLKLSKPTVYYYVPDKEALLFECSRIASLQLDVAIPQARKEGRNGLECLRRMFVAYATIMTSDFGKCLILIHKSDLSEDSARRLWDGREWLNQQVREVIVQGMEDGSIKPCDPKIVSFAIFGAFNWVAHWHTPGGYLTPAEIADQFMTLFGEGLAA